MIRPRLDGYDLLGLGLVTIFAAWIVVTAAVQAGNPLPQVALLAGATAAYAVGRRRGGRRPVFVAAVIVLAILAGTVLSGPSAFSGGPLAPPLGYANANGAMVALGAAAAAIMATVANLEVVRQPAAVLAIVMLTLAGVNTSRAAIALTAGILVAAVVARWLSRWVALVAPLLIAVAVTSTIVLGLTHGSPTVPPLKDSLTGRRMVLWQEAIEITAGEPVFGVGPGMFAETSPTALADADARWAHSVYMEAAAETGIPGALLLGALLLWTFGALYRSRQDSRLVVIGTAAVTAFAIHAAIDYVASFPAVVLIAAILAGLASSRTEAAH